jgi:hypothetical protein
MIEVEEGAAAPQDQGYVGNGSSLLEQHKELLDGLRAKYDEIAVWAAPARFGGIIIAAVPENPRVTEKFINDANDPKIDRAVSMKSYALSSVVHPDREITQQIFNRKPFLPARIAGRVSEMAGADAKELGKD